MKLNQWMTAGLGLSVSLLWACPTLAAMTADNNFGLEAKFTGQTEGDRDLGTRNGGKVNGFGLDLRPWTYFERGNWSAYAQAQLVTATDIIETDQVQSTSQANSQGNDSNDGRKAKKSYAGLREFWVGYHGLFTPYPGEQLKFGRQRLRNDDGEWRDTNIEALNWDFDTTLLRAHAGVAERFSEYRTDLTELAPADKDRLHVYGDAYYQWKPSQWVGLRAHHTHDDGKLRQAGSIVDTDDKTSNGDLTWLGVDANSDAYNYHNTNQFNYWANATWLTGNRHSLAKHTDTVSGESISDGHTSGDVNAWATDLGVRFRLDPMWQVGGAYARGSGGGGSDGSKNYEQNGLQSNRSTFTGTRTSVQRFGEAFRGELGNVQDATAFGTWQLRDEYDASLIYHKFWRVNGNQRIGSNSVDALVDADGDANTLQTAALKDGEKDLGQEMDLVVTKYFKTGFLPASISQYSDEPSALVRFRGGVFKAGNAYGKGVDTYMHRAFVDVIWRF